MALGEDLEELPVELVLAIWGVRMSPAREGAGREGIRTRPVLSMPGSTPGYSTQVTPVLGSTVHSTCADGTVRGQGGGVCGRERGEHLVFDAVAEDRVVDHLLGRRCGLACAGVRQSSPCGVRADVRLGDSP